MILNERKKIILRKLEGQIRNLDGGSNGGNNVDGETNGGSNGGNNVDDETNGGNNVDGETNGGNNVDNGNNVDGGNNVDNGNTKKDDDEEKYEECEGMTAYESTDCFEIELDFKQNIKKCCFLEYKDKKYDNKRRRSCTILTNDQFLDIKKTIKSIKDNNKNVTVLSLECDKANILSLNNALLLILLLFPL